MGVLQDLRSGLLTVATDPVLEHGPKHADGEPAPFLR